MNSIATRVAMLAATVALAGCGSDAASSIDSTLEKLDGTESYEYEQEGS